MLGVPKLSLAQLYLYHLIPRLDPEAHVQHRQTLAGDSEPGFVSRPKPLSPELAREVRNQCARAFFLPFAQCVPASSSHKLRLQPSLSFLGELKPRPSLGLAMSLAYVVGGLALT